MLQGDAFNIEFSIRENGVLVTPELVDDVEICVGKIIKTASSGEVSFDADRWKFPLRQQDTFSLQTSTVDGQVRILFKNGEVRGVKIKPFDISRSISKAILGEEND